ncbi:MAG: hypothetical protein V8R78_04625, partial [Evtepia gabavorous]
KAQITLSLLSIQNTLSILFCQQAFGSLLPPLFHNQNRWLLPKMLGRLSPLCLYLQGAACYHGPGDNYGTA